MTQSASKSFEEKVTESVTKTEIPRRISRKMSHADAAAAVTEAEREKELLIAEIKNLEQRLDEVMGQTRALIACGVHEPLLVTQSVHIEMNSALPPDRLSRYSIL